MNQRIRELAEQATILTRAEINNPNWNLSSESNEEKMWQEKFAKLVAKDIVAEIDTILQRNLKNNHWTIPEELICWKIEHIIKTKFDKEQT